MFLGKCFQRLQQYLIYKMSFKKGLSSFIQKLWSLLEGEQKVNHLICWTRQGLSFAIVDQKMFCQSILPLYFRHSNFSSFVRQLHIYNFHKVKIESEFEFQFQHQLFRKGHKQLLLGLKRKPSQYDLIHGRELLKKLNLKDINQQSQNYLLANQPTSESKIEKENNFISNSDLMDQLFISNYNLKIQNRLLYKHLNQLKIKQFNNTKKVELFLEGLVNYNIPLSSINFKSIDFINHFESSVLPFSTPFDYLQFCSDTVNYLRYPQLYWAVPIFAPIKEISQDNLYYK